MSLLSNAPTQFTGTGRYVSELLREFGRRPTDVSVDILAEPGVASLGATGVAANVTVHPIRGYRTGGSRASRLAALSAASVFPRPLARQFSPDVDIVHYPLTFKVPAVRTPTVLSFFDVQHHDLPHHFPRAEHLWRRWMYDRAARGATRVVTISEHARTRIIECVGVDPHRIVAIHLAVDHERFRPEPGKEDERLLSELGLPERFLFYPASLWPHKNHLRLLDAMAIGGDERLGLILTGATFGKLSALTAEADRRGLGGRVRHLGHVADDVLPALYRQATALVFPSLHEGFGIPPVEAMACGCPVASSREAALAEVCATASAELDPRDAEQMAEAIEAAVNDEALRARLRASGLRQAQRFTWSQNAKAHIAAYHEALEDGGGL